MKKTYLIVLVTSLVLAAGIIAAGCVQSNDNSQGQQTGNTLPSVQGTEQSNGQRPQMDLAAAAANLGVTEQQLSDALDSTRNATSGRTDFTAAAQQLGITRQQLTDALGIQYQNRTMSNGQHFPMNLTSAAANLSVTEQQLSDALNSTRNATSGRTDFTAAAQNLGVTEQQLRDALGIPAGNRSRSGGYYATQAQGQ